MLLVRYSRQDPVEPITILFAFLCGVVFRRFGFPPLPGYLLAGFISHSLGLGDVDLISAIADIGILLLLFTIGLKLNVRELAAPQVWGVASLQILIAVPLTALVIIVAGMIFPVLYLEKPEAPWVLAFALSFSSTVFAVKMFDDRGETISLHAKLAIGVLVIQDILAVIYLVLASDTPPGPAAFILLALPLLRPVGLYLLKHAGHGELVLLFGITIALGTAHLFEFFHLEGGLGALLAGVLLANSSRSKELYDSLISLKDLFLIGFFLQIGYYGLPSGEMVLVALALSLLIVIRPVLYYLLFVAFRLRARTSLLASFALFNYSEFGLIVAAIATSQGLLPAEWLTTLALAMSISFFIATPFNTNVHRIYQKFRATLHGVERHERLDKELPANLEDARIVVLGMGRVGRGAYDYFAEQYPNQVVGVEENFPRVLRHQNSGVNCVHADASDRDFWEHSGMQSREIVLLSLSNHAENVTTVKLARDCGFTNKLAVVSRYPDEQKQLEGMGCIVFNLYAEAGYGFAEHVSKHITS
ncbi:MAG: glutathione-regulated potassium-efflux system ancillary protein KefC [Candidatus Azotimanducaceae bacterium]|jgi:glutathione-regulated potassium-efflux system ancillary protein KefC